MAAQANLIKVDDLGRLSFGDHESTTKLKQDGFEFNGDTYKVKTYNEITRLEKNKSLIFESVPGSKVRDFELVQGRMSFKIGSNAEDAQITVELLADKEYKIFINGIQAGKVDTKLAGKINFSVDFANGEQEVEIRRI